MSFGSYRLLSQIASGRDGVRYRATDEVDHSIVELVTLSEARSDPLRWDSIVRRLKLAWMVEHPSSRKLLAVECSNDPPFVVLEWVDGPTLFEAGREEDDAIPRTIELAEALAAGHKFGLSHGSLGPNLIRLRESGGPVLDWTGLALASGDRSVTPSALDLSCLAPEQAEGGEPTASADVFALGAILDWRLAGISGSSLRNSFDVRQILAEMLADQPTSRPSARAVVARLSAEVMTTRMTQVFSSGLASASSVTTEIGGNGDVVEHSEAFNRTRLGRFQLLERLGEGGMGTVYRGEDLSDGTSVAIKVLKPSYLSRPDSLRRFHKEARLLAEVSNSRVANLIEINEDDGVHYLALEFVDGINLADWSAARGAIDERAALSILADVARALEAAHERGIVHRDIKPENILVVREPGVFSDVVEVPIPRVKLSDFGLARHVVESESLVLTRDGAIIGTPLYMSPEQCAGEREIKPASDVYAMGATLFALLAGRPPFLGDLPLIVMSKHRNEPPPDLKTLCPTVSDAVCSIVSKALAKLPEHRYATAGELLVDMERLLRGEPTGLELHPRLPSADARDVVCYDWRWDMEASPRALWPLVSNTERFNRAIGLSSVQFDVVPDPAGGSKTSGKFRKSGLEFSWREHPFEWIEERRMGVVREFEKGPFEWFVSVVELNPKSGGGTTLSHQVKIKPRGLIGRTIAAFEIGTRGRKSIDRVYSRVDAALTGKLGRDPTIDAFEAPVLMSSERRKRLELWLDTLVLKGFDPMVVERLGDFLELAPSQEVARIRPIALARRLGLEADAVVDACFRGAAEGVLILLWDLLCPVCRIPSQVIGTLRALEDHGHCESCRIDYDLDFANSVEVIFRVHPEIRETDLGTYCAGSPSHSPHVAAQARVSPGERMVVDLTLETGSYRLRGPQLPYSIDFRVEPGVTSKKWLVDLKAGPGFDTPRALRAGGQVIELVNAHDREILVRIERIAPREDALTAARASTLAIFRELFPSEVLSPGQLVNLETITLLVTDVHDSRELYSTLGDARAFGVLLELFRKIDRITRREGGALIKTIHEGTVSAFNDPSAALKAGLELLRDQQVAEKSVTFAIKAAIHRGSAMVATLNNHLDYFGATVSAASRLPTHAGGGQLVLTRPVASDPKVASLLVGEGLTPVVLEVEIEGLLDRFVHVIELKETR